MSELVQIWYDLINNLILYDYKIELVYFCKYLKKKSKIENYQKFPPIDTIPTYRVQDAPEGGLCSTAHSYDAIF